MRKLLLLSLLTIPAVAGPIIGGACADGTLAEYIALGSTGCTTTAGVLLSDFAYTPTNTILAETVAVTLVEDSMSRTNFLVSGAWAAENDETISFDLAWAWSASPGFREETYLNSGATAGTWTMSLTSLGHTELFSSAGSSGFGFGIGAGDTTGVAHAIGTATVGPGSLATIATYRAVYEVPVPSSVPEPTTWGMMGLGVAAIVRFARPTSRRIR